MEEKQLAKREISFVSDALQTLEKAQEWAQTYLDSKLAPSHFYEKDSEGNVLYDKGNVGGLLAVVAHGHEVGMSVSQSVQQIVPIRGVTTIKGDGAKALILASGKCELWTEHYEGSESNGDLTFFVMSKRRDNGEQIESSFSMVDAKKAGLWVTEEKLKQKSGLRYSPWYTYKKRMLRYRGIGFLARDLYPDVMQGLVTLEEAQDYPPEGTTVIETPSGQKIHIDPTDATQERSGSLTGRLAQKLAVQDSQFVDQESLIDVQEQHVYTEEELTTMGQGIFSKVKKEFPELNDLLEQIMKSGLRGKKTREAWRKGVLAWQRGEHTLEELEENYRVVSPPEGEQPDTVSKSKEQEEFEKAFDAGNEEEKVVHHDVNISPLPEDGSRTFDEKRRVFIGLTALGVTQDNYKEFAGDMLKEYGTLDDFAKKATVEQVVELIDVYIAQKA